MMNFHPFTYKCRIYPSETQIKKFIITLDSCKLLYNELLKIYKSEENCKCIPDLKKYFRDCSNLLKSKYSSISYLSDSTIDDVITNLLRAIRNSKDPSKLKFKDDVNFVKSFLIKNSQEIRLDDNYLYFGDYGKLKLYYGKVFSYYTIISYRVMLKNKKWFVMITVRSDIIEPFEKTGEMIGVDLGIRHLIILSDGTKYDPPDLSKINLKIKKLNKKLFSKVQGSRKYDILLEKLNYAHDHRKNIVLDYYHKLSTYLVREYDLIAMEDLKISEMIQDPRFSRNIYHRNWYKLVYMIRYKCHIYGKQFIQVKRNYPSTQLCSNCGFRYEGISIDERMWECPKCKSIHDRDVNAAKNILKEALKCV